MTDIMLNFKIGIKRVISKFGFQISFNSNPQEIKEFIDLCHPKFTDKKLIRIGDDSDGGYLIPNDLDGINYCFSPGVDQTASFEFEMAKRDISSFMIDYSVDAPPIENTMFHFEKKFLGITNDDVFTTLDSWVRSKNIDDGDDLLLQMDIEGAEYDTLLNTTDETILKFRIIVIEFHGLDELINPKGLQIIRSTFSRLLKNHSIVHIHPNNISPIVKYKGLEIPPTMEFTFLRNDRFQNSSFESNFPNLLDAKCIPTKEDIILPQTWYHQK
jgi:hypothetical protein